MVQLADAIGAEDAAFGTQGPQGIAWLHAPRTDPAWLALYAREFHGENLFWHRTVASPVGQVCAEEALISSAERRQSRYHADWSRPQGYRHKLGVVVARQPGWQSVLMLPARRRFAASASGLLHTLAPHLARAVAIQVALAREQGLATLAGLLAAENAVFVVDAGAGLVQANAAAQALLGPAQALLLRAGEVRARQGNGPQSALLQRIGLAATRGEAGEISLPSTGPAQPGLRLLVTPLPQALAWLAPGVPAALLVQAPQSRGEKAQSHWSRRFGFTPAEAAFAWQIVQGDGKPAAALRAGIRYSTARSHLSRIFDKTGVRRQAELVRLLAADLTP